MHAVSFLYPWFLPLLFLVGPGLYGSFCTIKERRDKWHLIHYLPMLIGYIILIVHLAGFNDHFYETVQLARDLKWAGTRNLLAAIRQMDLARIPLPCFALHHSQCK